MKLLITIKCKPDYTCTTCRKTMIGTDTYTVTATTAESATYMISEFTNNPPRAGIPVGWKSFGTAGIQCNECYLGRNL